SISHPLTRRIENDHVALMKSPNRRFLAVAELAETALNRLEHMFPAFDTDPEPSHRSPQSRFLPCTDISRLIIAKNKLAHTCLRLVKLNTRYSKIGSHPTSGWRKLPGSVPRNALVLTGLARLTSEFKPSTAGAL